jgi:hypothetical protein
VGASSNHACATCPTVAMVRYVRVPVANLGTSSNRACATCPTVALGEVRPLLQGHHSSDGTAAVGRFPVATEAYYSSGWNLRKDHLTLLYHLGFIVGQAEEGPLTPTSNMIVTMSHPMSQA